MRGRLAGFASTVTSTGAAAAGALALLVLGCVFVAVAGPRASLGVRTRALRHTLAAVAPLDTAVQATADSNEFEQAPASANRPDLSRVTPADLSTVQRQLAGELSADGLPLGPRGDAWAGLSTGFAPVSGAGPRAQAQVGPRLQVVYRDALGRHAQLVAGRYPPAAPLRDQRIAVTVTQPTASRFGLHPGSRLRLATPTGSTLTIEVSGVVRPLGPSSAFWMVNPTLAAPALISDPPAPAYWEGDAEVGAGGLGALESAFFPTDLPMLWAFPLRLTQLGAQQAGPMMARLNGIGAHNPTLTGPLGASAAAITFATPAVTQDLLAFLTAQDAVGSVLSLVFVGLTVVGAVVLMLAAQMVTARRAAEWAVLRARGASLRQLAALALRDTAVAVVPATLLGAALAVALTPGESVPLAWWLGTVTAAVALAGPSAAAVIRHRPVRQEAIAGQAGTLQPGGVAPVASRRHAVRRLVAEVAMIVAAVGGLVLLRFEGLPQTGGVNLFTSAAPVLVAVPAAIVVLRLYPLAVRLVMRLCARRAGVTGFLAMGRAGRAPVSILPVFALVLALSLAAFAGMVRDAVARGEVAASWRATGADAVVAVGTSTGRLTPATVRALAHVPGAQQAAEVRVLPWVASSGTVVTVVAVDPASYAALVAGTPWPPLRAGALARPRAGPAPVLASPAAAAALGPGTVRLESAQEKIAVRVAGVLPDTPALPGGGTFVVLPAWALPAAARSRPPNLMLLNGAGLDGAQLTAVTHRRLPGAAVSLRSADLARLTGSPLPRGAYLGFAAALGAATGFSVAVLLLDLALGARSRRMTQAWLAAMGLGGGQARRLTLLEILPGVLAAALAGVGCALALVPLTGPVLDLSVFTGSPAAVPVRPDPVALGLPVAGLVAVAIATVLLQLRAERQRAAAATLRVAE